MNSATPLSLQMGHGSQYKAHKVKGRKPQEEEKQPINKKSLAFLVVMVALMLISALGSMRRAL